MTPDELELERQRFIENLRTECSCNHCERARTAPLAEYPDEVLRTAYICKFGTASEQLELRKLLSKVELI